MLQDDQINITDRRPGIVRGKAAHQHPHLTYIKPGTIVLKVDGVERMLDYIAETMPQPKNGDSSTKRKDGDDDFNAFNTYAEAMDTFRNHPEKVVVFNESELKIKDDSESGSRVDYDVTGDYIDLGRFMEGIPETWGSMHNGNARNRRVNLMINTNQYWGVRHEDITHRGERILRLVDALEAGGVRTQITVMESSECDHVEVTIKQHDEPLTISDLAVTTHPEFLRRIIFRVIEHSDTFEYSYGSALKFGDKVAEKPEILTSGANINDEINIFIDGNFEGKTTIDKRFDEVERLLQWELSKAVPEVDAIRVDKKGLYFNPNGQRASEEIKREGLEAINEK